MSFPKFAQRLFANAGAGPKLLGSIIPFGTAAGKAPGVAAAGALDECARADHVHPLPGVATQAAAGLMSAADKIKLDALKLTLEIPQGTMNFYVSKSGSDAITDASGTWIQNKGSAASPFLTIQACADFVADRYNVGNARVSILVGPGTYDEDLVLPDYKRGSGTITIRPATAADLVTIRHEYKISQYSRRAVRAAGGVWVLDGLVHSIKLTEDDDTRTGNCYKSHFEIAYGASLTMQGVKTYVDTNVDVATRTLIQYLCQVEGELRIRPKSSVRDQQSEWQLSPQALDANKRIYVYSVGDGGKVLAHGASPVEGFSTSANPDAEFWVSGGYSTFMYVNGGYYSPADANDALRWVVRPITSGDPDAIWKVAGTRWRAQNGGRIRTATGNGKSDYFPGTVDGNADPETYSWYK